MGFYPVRRWWLPAKPSPPRRWGGPHARAPLDHLAPAACAGREREPLGIGTLPPVRGAARIGVPFIHLQKDASSSAHHLELAMRILEGDADGSKVARSLLRPMLLMVAHQARLTGQRTVHRADRPGYMPDLHRGYGGRA